MKKEPSARRLTKWAVLLPSAVLFLALWLFLLFAGRSAMLRDPGSFWHVVAGEKMLSTGHILRNDPFSFTVTGHSWVADQWLAECGMAAVHRLAGWDGLLLLAASVLAALYTWITRRLLGSGLHWLPAGLLLALILLIGSPQFHVRPLVVTLGLLAVSFAWLVDVEAGKKAFRQLWWLVPLVVLWANLHGGVLGGLGTVGLCVAGWCLAGAFEWLSGIFRHPQTPPHCNVLEHFSEIFRHPQTPPHCNGGDLPAANSLAAAPSDSSPVRHLGSALELLALLAALAAATLVNPYGLKLPWEWWETLALPLPSLIDEHRPLNLTEPIGWATMLLAAGYLIVLVGVFPRRPRITWLVPLVWFLLALGRVRNAALLAVVAAIALADMLPHSRVGQWLAHRDLLTAPRPSVGWRAVVLPLVVVLTAIGLQLAGIGAASRGARLGPIRSEPLAGGTIAPVGTNRPLAGGRPWHFQRFELRGLSDLPHTAAADLYRRPLLALWRRFSPGLRSGPLRESGPDRWLAAAVRFSLCAGGDGRAVRSLPGGRGPVDARGPHTPGNALPAAYGRFRGRALE